MNSQCLPENIRRAMSSKDRQPLGKHALTMPEIEAKNAIKSEKELQTQIANYLRQRGIPFRKSRMDKRDTGTIGWPDFVLPFKGSDRIGRFVSLECKVVGGVLSREQMITMDQIRQNGGLAVVVTSLDQVKSILDTLE